MLFQEPDIADQVCPAVLGFDPEVPCERAVGRKVVEVQIACKLRTDQLLQDFARTRGGDVKQAERGRRDAPNPVPFAVVFAACLVAAQLFLPGDRLGQFAVGIGQRCGDRARAELGQVATRDRHLQNVFHPRFEGRVAAMADRFEPADHCQEPGSEDRPFQLGAIGDVDVAVGILVDSQSVFRDMNRGVRQFNVLDDIEVTGGSQSETPHFAVIDFIVDRQPAPAAAARAVAADAPADRPVCVSCGVPASSVSASV